MSTERGLLIQETVRAMEEESHFRQLAEQRDRRMAQKRAKQRKEADKAATLTTSSDINNVKNTLNNYTNKQEECQDVKFDPPGDTSGGEVRQQGQDRELPVFLL